MNSVNFMVQTYPNSPLIDAICDIEFSEKTEWDPTISGIFYEKIKEKYPNKYSRTKKECDGLDESGNEIRLSKKEYVVFSSDDKKIEILLGNRNLIVRVLKPYPSWDVFYTAIEYAISKINEILKNFELSDIELKYSNIVDNPSKKLEYSSLFNLKPNLGSNLPNNISDFIIGCEFPFEENNAFCRVLISSEIPDKPVDPIIYIFNINYSSINPEKLLLKDVLKWIGTGHTTITTIFEGCITDNLRKKYKGE